MIDPERAVALLRAFSGRDVTPDVSDSPPDCALRRSYRTVPSLTAGIFAISALVLPFSM